MGLTERFTAHLSTLELGAGRVLVAVSGGPDSLVLLDLLVETRAHHALELLVAHLDHGIQPESGLVAERVRTALQPDMACLSKWGVSRLVPPPPRPRRGHNATPGWRPRAARVGADFILTAHHADDQVETVLMRVLAGSGPAGLAGMASRQGRVVRPLLPFTRAELEEHLRSAGLEPWLDPANADPRHLRSWLRTELLPMLRGRLAEVDSNLQRIATPGRGATARPGMRFWMPCPASIFGPKRRDFRCCPTPSGAMIQP